MAASFTGPPAAIINPLHLDLKTSKSFLSGLQDVIRQQRLPEYLLIIILSTALIFLVMSFLRDIVLPPVVLVFSAVDLSDWKIVLRPSTTPSRMTCPPLNAQQPEVAIRLGQFLESAVVSLALVALSYWGIRSMQEKRERQTETEKNE